MKYIFSKDCHNAATWENRIEIANDSQETLEALTMAHWIKKGLVFKLTSMNTANGQCDKVELADDLYLPAIEANRSNIDYLRTLYQAVKAQKVEVASAFSSCDGLLNLIFKHAYKITINETVQNLIKSGEDASKLILEALDYDLDVRSQVIKTTQAVLSEESEQENQ